MESFRRPRILVFVDYYLPGYKAGGPLRTIANMVEAIGDQFEFIIVARDRDATDLTPYTSVQADAWNNVGKASVFYASPQSLSPTNLGYLIKDVTPDVVYLNSFFSQVTRRYLMLRRSSRIDKKMVTIIAPRGEFSPGALQLKSLKKRTYIFWAKRLGLYNNLLWHASSEQERDEIFQGWSSDTEVFIAPNVPEMIRFEGQQAVAPPLKKVVGQARFVFVSRITPKKNLAFALDLLQRVSGNVEFSIYGPVRDDAYWQKCQQQIQNLPDNVTIQFFGAIPHHEVLSAFGQSHFFLFPTLGENYGHVILEAMAAGCPVLTSDQTFWRGLQQKGVGWDISLENQVEWQQTIQMCIDMDEITYQKLSGQTRKFHDEWVFSDAILQSNIVLFERASKT